MAQTWLMTSSWYRGHRVLSHLMFWGSVSDLGEVTKRSNVYRLWGISPVRGVYVPRPTARLVDARRTITNNKKLIIFCIK